MQLRNASDIGLDLDLIDAPDSGPGLQVVQASDDYDGDFDFDFDLDDADDDEEGEDDDEDVDEDDDDDEEGDEDYVFGDDEAEEE